VLDALGVERAHVYGTSMGGKVAQWVAIDHPGRVGALVLGCTTPGGPDGLVAGPEVVGPLAGPTAAAADLDRIAAPTLVLHGTDDVFCPAANADLLVKGVPGAKMVLLDGARHAYFLERREEASRVVLDFLAGYRRP